jgi:hypothetical protein
MTPRLRAALKVIVDFLVVNVTRPFLEKQRAELERAALEAGKRSAEEHARREQEGL